MQKNAILLAVPSPTVFVDFKCKSLPDAFNPDLVVKFPKVIVDMFL